MAALYQPQISLSSLAHCHLRQVLVTITAMTVTNGIAMIRASHLLLSVPWSQEQLEHSIKWII